MTPIRAKIRLRLKFVTDADGKGCARRREVIIFRTAPVGVAVVIFIENVINRHICLKLLMDQAQICVNEFLAVVLLRIGLVHFIFALGEQV